jgi:hypothetical protein
LPPQNSRSKRSVWLRARRIANHLRKMNHHDTIDMTSSSSMTSCTSTLASTIRSSRERSWVVMFVSPQWWLVAQAASFTERAPRAMVRNRA